MIFYKTVLQESLFVLFTLYLCMVKDEHQVRATVLEERKPGSGWTCDLPCNSLAAYAMSGRTRALQEKGIEVRHWYVPGG